MENAASTSNALFCPTTHSYAVIRMDPVAMVEHLDDAEALASARALCPKSYVVYIDCVSSSYPSMSTLADISVTIRTIHSPSLASLGTGSVLNSSPRYLLLKTTSEE